MFTNDLFRPTAQLKIAVTPDCNNDCPICFNETTRSRNGQRKSLSSDKILELIDEAANIGMLGTYWTGGEPMLRFKELLKFMEYSTRKGMPSTIVTNGGMIDPFGKYKDLNVELIRKACLDRLKEGESLKLMKEAGLVRIYFSVDNCHTTIANADSGVFDRVPAEIISKAIKSCIRLGFGKIHKLEAIGYQLRVTASASGKWSNLSEQIIKKVMKDSNVKLLKSPRPGIEIYGNEKGRLFVRKRGVYAHGDAKKLDRNLLAGADGKGLFQSKCPIFNPREQAYDGGKYHGDLLVNFDGVVYTCGGSAYPVGNVFDESLSSVVKSIDSGKMDGKFSTTRAVYHRLLKLTKLPGVGNAAIGKAFEMIHQKKPELTKDILLGCGACCALGQRKDLQKTFIKAYDETYS
jgi:MoaA/NifB/PqqE/SkfB family radical SAM enzyme